MADGIHGVYSSLQAAAGGSAPSAATDGTGLIDCVGFAVTVAAVANQTLSGSGTLLGWTYNPDIALWARCPDLDLSVTVSGLRVQSFAAWQVIVPRQDRVYYQTSSVGISGGTNVTIYLAKQVTGMIYG